MNAKGGLVESNLLSFPPLSRSFFAFVIEEGCRLWGICMPGIVNPVQRRGTGYTSTRYLIRHSKHDIFSRAGIHTGRKSRRVCPSVCSAASLFASRASAAELKGATGVSSIRRGRKTKKKERETEREREKKKRKKMIEQRRRGGGIIRINRATSYNNRV